MPTLSRFAIPAVVFLLTLAFGFWLSRAGRPYNGLLFNAHKLVALAAVVITVVQLIQMFRGADLPGLLIAVLVLAALCIAALFASGALMSAGKLGYARLHTIHRVALAALISAASLTIHLIAR
jgi:hypothetical protein